MHSIGEHRRVTPTVKSKSQAQQASVHGRAEFVSPCVLSFQKGPSAKRSGAEAEAEAFKNSKAATEKHDGFLTRLLSLP